MSVEDTTKEAYFCAVGYYYSTVPRTVTNGLSTARIASDEQLE